MSAPPPHPSADPGDALAAAQSRLPTDELASLASDYGLDPSRYRRRGELVVALAERRTLIGTLDRTIMLEIVRWGRRPVAADANREQLAREIARIHRWQFAELSHDALRVLAKLRGVRLRGGETPRELVKKLQKTEGIAARLARKRRLVVANFAAKLVGDEDDGVITEASDEPYKFLPSDNGPQDAKAAASETLRERIEERGLFGGIADRVRKSADVYVNQKLDEIEARIDRKLDEIDKRLGEWRDKEVANRIRILKITLWASVIVSIVSLIYAYLTQQVF